MLELSQLKLLAKAVANADPSSKVAYSYGEEKLSYSELNETLRSELNALAGDYKSFRENKNTVFTIIETVVDEVLPKKVMQAYDMFAETKVFAQGDRPEFIIKTTEASRRRAKQFITKVGLAGVYEVFKLDGRDYEVPTSAFGGAAQIGLEEFLDGRVDFAELTEIVMEGLDEAIYKEIAKALISSIIAVIFSLIFFSSLIFSPNDSISSISSSMSSITSDIIASSLVLPAAILLSFNNCSVSSKEYVLPSICDDFQLRSMPNRSISLRYSLSLIESICC